MRGFRTPKRRSLLFRPETFKKIGPLTAPYLSIYLSIRTCIGLHDITITGSTTDEKVESIHPSSQRNRGLTTDKLTHRKKKSKRVSNTKPGLPGLFYIITQRDHLKLWIMSYSTASTKGGFPLLKSPEIRF